MKSFKNNQLIRRNLDFSALPSMPASALKVLSQVFDADVDIGDLIQTIKQDIALTAEIIKVANSPIYRLNSPVENINNAVMHLGLDQIKKIALTTSVVNTIQDKLSEENYFLIMSYSMGTATAAQILAEQTPNVDPDTAFLIGLFLNLGLFACASLFPEKFEIAKQEASHKSIHLNTVLGESLLTQVHEITLKVAQQWQLPLNIIDSIRSQELIDQKRQNPNLTIPPLTIIAHLSEKAADVLFGASSLISIEKFKEDLKLFMNKSEEDAAEILDLLSDEFNKLSTALDVGMPQQPCYTDILKKANTELLKLNAKYEQMYKELSEKNQAMQKMSEELDRQNRRLKKLVTIDPLTALFNRRFLEKGLERLISECKRYKTKLSLIILDIDLFKKINDQNGHLAGDEVLVRLSSTLRLISRTTDICARYGGEEFIVVLPHTNLSEAHIMAEKCRKAISEMRIHLHMVIPQKEIYITASFGIAEFSEHNNTIDKLIQAADSALYEAKANGRNCIYPK